jgi:3-hydroxy-5-methyl-1-naphthoate 3-O-methyltransferase
MDAPANQAITPQRIMQLGWGFAAPLAITAAIETGLFNALVSGPKTLLELQETTSASERGLAAIADFLVGIDLLAKENSGRFRLTPESDMFLVKGKPTFQGGLIVHATKSLLPAWLDLSSIVRTGRPAKDISSQQVGAVFFQDFVEDLFPINYAGAKTLVETLAAKGLPNPPSVLDLAAGSGVWGIAVAQASPEVHVTAVDWADVLEVTKRVATRFGLAGRFTFSPGNLLEAEFGTNHGLAVLGHILHSEGEERSRKLLAKTFNALAPGGIIAIAEFLVNADRAGPVPSLVFSINMLVNTEAGRTYSFEEIAGWLRQTSFVDPRLLEIPGFASLILANKPVAAARITNDR